MPRPALDDGRRSRGSRRSFDFPIELSCEPLYYDSMTLRTQHEKPVYVRLRETIADAILAGKYRDGDPLPSVRAFAAEEQANPLTVAKAYQGFQDEGLIVVKRGVGMFVAPGARARLSDSERTPLPQGGMARDPRAHAAGSGSIRWS